jgi:hypothetical protein
LGLIDNQADIRPVYHMTDDQCPTMLNSHGVIGSQLLVQKLSNIEMSIMV